MLKLIWTKLKFITIYLDSDMICKTHYGYITTPSAFWLYYNPSWWRAVCYTLPKSAFKADKLTISGTQLEINVMYLKRFSDFFFGKCLYFWPLNKLGSLPSWSLNMFLMSTFLSSEISGRRRLEFSPLQVREYWTQRQHMTKKTDSTTYQYLRNNTSIHFMTFMILNSFSYREGSQFAI